MRVRAHILGFQRGLSEAGSYFLGGGVECGDNDETGQGPNEVLQSRIFSLFSSNGTNTVQGDGSVRLKLNL